MKVNYLQLSQNIKSKRLEKSNVSLLIQQEFKLSIGQQILAPVFSITNKLQLRREHLKEVLSLLKLFQFKNFYLNSRIHYLQKNLFVINSMNKLFVVLLTILLTTNFVSCQIRTKFRGPGGWDQKDRLDYDQNINKFIKETFPKLANACIVEIEEQIVAGINYRYTYVSGAKQWTITVFDQPWSQIRQVSQIKLTVLQEDDKGSKKRVTKSTKVNAQADLLALKKQYFGL